MEPLDTRFSPEAWHPGPTGRKPAGERLRTLGPWYHLTMTTADKYTEKDTDENSVPLPEAPGNGNESEQKPLGLFQVIGSALAAAFGVQSSRNRERDFTRGRASHFIVAGVIFTALFVVAVVLVVRLVLSLAAG